MSRGRPRKYENSSFLGVWVPAELKNFLRELSFKTRRSMGELVVEALLNYYKEVKVGNVEVREEKSARSILRELELRRIERELRAHERDVEKLEKLRARNVMHVTYRGMTIPIWDAIVRKQNSLHGLMKKMAKLEQFDLKLGKYAEKAKELIERLEEIK